MIVSSKAPHREGWMPMIHRSGIYRPLAPHIIPICGDQHEVLERIRIRAGQDPEFRARFDGCWAAALRFDNGFQIHRNIKRMRS